MHLSNVAENVRPYKNLYRDIIAALFLTAKTWKQPKYSLKCSWITKLWYNQTMQWSTEYSTKKKKKMG
jgi:hypothetical protein